MNRTQRLLAWLDDRSDWLSPIVVKEVRQIVRGREFNYSFAASLIAGLAVAFFGAADALTGNGTSGWWTFAALMGCLALLGLGVVPLGAFSALRNERLEQTLDLITLTALSPRRVVVGKLLAQSVKLVTLFAGIAPFVAMSFLLGGIDFVTILMWLAIVFMASLWACAVCLFLSTLFTSRAMSGLIFGAFGIVLFLLFVVTRSVFFSFGVGHVYGSAGADPWWILTVASTFCIASMINLVLLAENRLTLSTENRVTLLRAGFLVQFLLIVGWTLSFIGYPENVRSNAAEMLGVFGGLHLALVALFTVTEDLIVPRRVVLRMHRSSSWKWLEAIFMPGGGRGAAYVLAQMVVLLVAACVLDPDWMRFRWLLAICCYICFFTGVPAAVLRYGTPERSAAVRLRVTVLILLPLVLLLPDFLHYVFWRPEALTLTYSRRHLINPFRTLANWAVVETYYWFIVPFVLGLMGLVAYLTLIRIGSRLTARPAAIDPLSPAATARESGSANVLY